MMESQYRAFGDTPKVWLAAGQSIDLTGPVNLFNSTPFPERKFKSMHASVVADSNVTAKQTFDVTSGGGTLTGDVKAGGQVVGLNFLTCNSGLIQVLLFT